MFLGGEGSSSAVVLVMWLHTPPPPPPTGQHAVVRVAPWPHTQNTARWSHLGCALPLCPIGMCDGRWPVMYSDVIWGFILKLGALLGCHECVWPDPPVLLIEVPLMSTSVPAVTHMVSSTQNGPGTEDSAQIRT